MKKILCLVLANFVVSVYVVQASPMQEKQGELLKYKQYQAFQQHDVITSVPITCIDFTLPDVISVPVPSFTDVTISYCFVTPILNPTQGITSRCNSPPFY